MAKGEPIRVALLGAGTVGAAVARTLLEKQETYSRQLGCPFALDCIIVKDPTKQRDGIPSDLLTTDFNRALEPDVDVVVEMMGVEDPAVDYMAQALVRRKYVVTANKEVMSKHGSRLVELASRNGVELLYEASVGGGIPIVAPLKRDLLANKIKGITAIINGTTNYILTAMSREGADFGDALQRA